jgi:ribonuclease HI
MQDEAKVKMLHYNDFARFVTGFFRESICIYTDGSSVNAKSGLKTGGSSAVFIFPNTIDNNRNTTDTNSDEINEEDTTRNSHPLPSSSPSIPNEPPSSSSSHSPVVSSETHITNNNNSNHPRQQNNNDKGNSNNPWLNTTVWTASKNVGIATNSEAELEAINMSLDILSEQEIDKGTPILLLSDSQFALGTVSGISFPHQHHQLIYTIRQKLLQFPNIVLRYVPSHMDKVHRQFPHIVIHGNRQADELAKTAALNKQQKETVLKKSTLQQVFPGEVASVIRPTNPLFTLLPYCYKRLSPEVMWTVLKSYQQDNYNQKWNSFKTPHFHTMDGLEAKLSNTLWRRLATRREEVRKLIQATMARCSVTNATAKLWGRRNITTTSCPFCVGNVYESLHHLLSACKSKFGDFYTKRSNEVVEMIGGYYERLKAFDKVLFNTSRRKDGLPQDIREQLPPQLQEKQPDIILRKGNKLFMVEVGVTSGKKKERINQKAQQYEELCETINNINGIECGYGVMLVGSTGVVFRDSFKTLRRGLKLVFNKESLKDEEKKLVRLCQKISRFVYEQCQQLINMRKAITPSSEKRKNTKKSNSSSKKK